ncbi:unnamed protein product [Moneuplotes crassus]|uniref:Uncharacterized protein n=2 Tax=Euplotes crassus TaxID=5936 RepID=A0AAD1UJI1_EUPCR|nr:unnamed protein product [Moneuplotes crassus]
MLFSMNMKRASARALKGTFPAKTRAVTRLLLGARNFSSDSKDIPNLVQLMPTYQVGLKLAIEKKYSLAMQKFELLLDEITDHHSPNTPYHVFALYKMASINNIAGDSEKNEEIFERITEIAPMAYPDNNSMVFRCYNTLLKYYLNYDVDKCHVLGKDMIDSKYLDYSKLIPHEKFDLQHTLGTAYGLEGTLHKESFDCYNESIEIADEYNASNKVPEAHIQTGFSLNNLGMSRFWYFMEKTKEISQSGEEDKSKIEAEVKKYVDTFEQGIKDLKKAVLAFENFDERFMNKEDGDLSQVDLKMKLFVQEFFDTEIKETLSKDFQHYDLRDNQMNTKFVSEAFEQGESTLPLANLGEISLIFNKIKEAMAFFDISLKLVGEKDPQNLISNKIVSDLSGIVDLMGQTDMTIKMNQNILRGLEKTDDYIKVFVLRNYGHILARHKEHKEEGDRYIKKADDLDRKFPYWAERKLGLFTPIVPHEPLENPL